MHEKYRVSRFSIYQAGDNCALWGEDGVQRGKRCSLDRTVAAGCILAEIREPKWKSRLNESWPENAESELWRGGASPKCCHSVRSAKERRHDE
jgi:hypothetical protein